ncbi:class I lanthipeptide [Flavobacterium cerinum]|uniref:Class I lanthipeptide n=1 Tax=Flavobacterium cerinum TaxID=2502784 RepID=A0ABY5ITL8_9FLAO|nr:class I lanthipeptide [Flavobacterium cerinum]UUC46185.1 class I lanthipeptide [Flavobacterium cerinum]
MKTQNANNKLAFNASTVTELTDSQMMNVDGATTVPCVGVAVASIALSYNISKAIFAAD